MGPDATILVFWMVSFKPTFSLSSFTFIKRLFSSLLSAIRVVSSAYLRLLIFLPAILIAAYASSSPAFLMMYSAYKLNKHGDNIQPFPIWNQSVIPCPVLDSNILYFAIKSFCYSCFIMSFFVSLFYFSWFYLSRKNCLMINQLCHENVCSKKICSKDVQQRYFRWKHPIWLSSSCVTVWKMMSRA